MAIFHFHTGVIKRSAGHTATAAAAYQSGECIVDERTGEIHDYEKRKEVIYANIFAPENAPEWVRKRSSLWNEVEKSENRIDAQVARSFDIALPKELTVYQNVTLAEEFCKEQMVRKGMIADLSIHEPHKKGDNNIHMHIKTTMRDIGPDGFGKKNRDWNQKELMEEWREQWAIFANRALEKAGHEARIDHRSYKDQGIDIEPTKHLGRAAKLEKKGIQTEKGNYNRTVIELNAYKKELVQVEKEAEVLDVEKRQVKAQIIDLQTQRQQREQQMAQVEVSRPVVTNGNGQSEAVAAVRESIDPPKSQLIEMTSGEICAVAEAEIERLLGELDVIRGKNVVNKGAPLTRDKAEDIAWNHVTNGKHTLISERDATLRKDNDAMKYYIKRFEDKWNDAGFFEKKNPYSAIVKERDKLDIHIAKLKARIDAHNEERKQIYDSPELRQQVAKHIDSLMIYDKKRIEQYNQIEATTEPIKNRIREIRKLKYDLEDCDKRAKFNVKDDDIEGIMQTLDLVSQARMAKAAERDMKRTRSRERDIGIER